VGIASRYGLGGPVIESRCGRDFLCRPDLRSSCKMAIVGFPGGG
jgi:hypothetical protein